MSARHAKVPGDGGDGGGGNGSAKGRNAKGCTMGHTSLRTIRCTIFRAIRHTNMNHRTTDPNTFRTIRRRTTGHIRRSRPGCKSPIRSGTVPMRSCNMAHIP